MKRTCIALFFVLASCAAVQAATCLSFRDIQSSESPDGKSLLFTMRDGKVWRGELRGACADIRMNGFSWDTDGGQLCENLQTIRVLRSGGICRLGKLTPVPASAGPARP